MSVGGQCSSHGLELALIGGLLIWYLRSKHVLHVVLPLEKITA